MTPFATLGSAVGVSYLDFDSAGNLYTANQGSSSNNHLGTISKITPGGVVSTFFTGTAFFPYQGIAIDGSDNVYVTVTGGGVQKITPGGASSAFLSNTSPAAFLDDIAFDQNGNLYGRVTNQLKRVSPDGQTITTLATTPDVPSGLIVAAVPEPSALGLSLTGIGLFTAGRRSRASRGNA